MVILFKCVVGISEARSSSSGSKKPSSHGSFDKSEKLDRDAQILKELFDVLGDQVGFDIHR